MPERNRARKFYIMTCNFAGKPPDFEVENLAVLRGSAGALAPPKGKRGFPAYPEVPRIVIGKLGKKAAPPTDIEIFHSYWLISDRLKILFEDLDPEAFAFQACEVRLANGSPGPSYWLCDVVRVLEAFGPSTLDDIRKHPYRAFLLVRESLVFNETAVGEAYVFSTPYSVEIFCDQRLKDACKQAGMKGATFKACFNK
ncbi:DUF1629 domain-containing protein [Bradyrhizobium septentrionale]